MLFLFYFYSFWSDYIDFCKCLFFFSSRRRHTSCALVTGVQTCALPIWQRRAYRWAHAHGPCETGYPAIHLDRSLAQSGPAPHPTSRSIPECGRTRRNRPPAQKTGPTSLARPNGDRKSVVKGKSGSVRVDLGGRRVIKQKKNKQTT